MEHAKTKNAIGVVTTAPMESASALLATPYKPMAHASINARKERRLTKMEIVYLVLLVAVSVRIRPLVMTA